MGCCQSAIYDAAEREVLVHVPGYTADASPITAAALADIASVIGPKGATIQALQHATGARIDVCGLVVSFVGEEAACAAARRRVAALLDASANPNYEGAKGAKHRKAADDLYAERAQKSRESQAAYQAGNNKLAGERSKEAKALQARAERESEAAAAAIFKFANKARGAASIDLHGLRANEALRYLGARLDERPGLALEIIAGAGHHSGSQGPVLSGKVHGMLKQRGQPFSQPRPGVFQLTCN